VGWSGRLSNSKSHDGRAPAERAPFLFLERGP
jgi:hypothetical protein